MKMTAFFSGKGRRGRERGREEEEEDSIWHEEAAKEERILSIYQLLGYADLIL